MYLFREKIHDLLTWKNKNERKPLLVKGARQTGKSFLIREFGKNYKNFFEFNFQKEPELKEVFKKNLNPQKIINELSIWKAKTINIHTDLVFFDEIQECPDALNSLKYFCEDYPKSHVISAGSLLGVYLSQSAFPVGKVELLQFYPMNFEEFLEAVGEVQLVKILKDFNQTKEIPHLAHEKLIDHVRDYYICGGLPEIVKAYVVNKKLEDVREKQKVLLSNYQSDFSKYADKSTSINILRVYENIPKQLAREFKKFQCSQITKGGRFSHFKDAIDWLLSSQLAWKIPIIKHIEIPLSQYVEENNFKFYFMDVGLLGCLADIPIESFRRGQDLLKTFKGALVENFVQQEMNYHLEKNIYSWVNSQSEIEFILQLEENIYPIEVKAGESGKLKSLNVYFTKYAPLIKTRISSMPYYVREDQAFQNIPLYLAGRFWRKSEYQ